MAQEPGTRGADGPDREPWHAAEVDADALNEDLPTAVVEAAKRAFGARLPGVQLARLVEEHETSEPAIREYVFQHDELLLRLDVTAHPTLHVRIRCELRPHAAVEVRHGGATVRAYLDRSGSANVPVEGGLLSVLVVPDSENTPPMQSAWVRIPT